MAGRISARMMNAMRLIVDHGMTPYTAAKRMQLAVSTMYRNRLYKLWRDAEFDELTKEMDLTRPLPPPKGKRKKIAIIK